MKKTIILNAGHAVRIGSLIPELTEPKYIKLPSGRELVLNPLERKENKLFVGDFEPCVILLNNDLSSGIPDILQGIEQNIRPPMHLGWSQRLKSNHFFYYQQIALPVVFPYLVNTILRVATLSVVSRR